MTSDVLLQLPADVHAAIQRHLLRGLGSNEEAAFVFVRPDTVAPNVLAYADWTAVPTDGFCVQLPYHFELTDEARASMIKRAHDLRASVVELHSHTNKWPAAFSSSDWAGFEELVPHMWWRLKGRPYAAVVFSQNSFDGLVWRTDPHTPERLAGILVDGQLLQPSRLSPLERDGYDWTL